MPELVISITRSRLPSEAYCNATPDGSDWPVCALRAGHLETDLGREAFPSDHECAAYTWAPYPGANLNLKSLEAQKEWDQLGRNSPDAVNPEDVGPITETVLRQDFRDEVTISELTVSWDGIPVGHIDFTTTDSYNRPVYGGGLHRKG